MAKDFIQKIGNLNWIGADGASPPSYNYTLLMKDDFTDTPNIAITGRAASPVAGASNWNNYTGTSSPSGLIDSTGQNATGSASGSKFATNRINVGTIGANESIFIWHYGMKSTSTGETRGGFTLDDANILAGGMSCLFSPSANWEMYEYILGAANVRVSLLPSPLPSDFTNFDLYSQFSMDATGTKLTYTVYNWNREVVNNGAGTDLTYTQTLATGLAAANQLLMANTRNSGTCWHEGIAAIKCDTINDFPTDWSELVP